jgi:Kdo2-lipid IVA lauroyltransferase/acyltransferase
VIRGMYHSLWQIPADLCYFSKCSEADLHQQIHNLEVFLEHLHRLPQDRGVVLVSAHLGPWELCAQTVARQFRPVVSLYKPSSMEWINRFLRAARHRHGQSTVDKEGGMVSLFKHVKRGGVAGLVMDQHGGNDGVPSKFLGKACRSWDSAVVLAQRAQCPVMAVGLIREGNGYRFLYSEPMSFPKQFSGAEQRLEAVAAVDLALSKMVAAAPEQWMWLGRRWGRNFKAQMGESLE